MPVPNTFANATTSIPLSQLDQNFATAITLGNTAIQLGNTVTTLNNMTLANVTVSSGNVTVTSLSGAFNGTVGATTPNTGAFTSVTANSTITFSNKGTLFAAGQVGFSYRDTNTALYLQMPTGGLLITDSSLNTKAEFYTAGASTGLAVTGIISTGTATTSGANTNDICLPNNIALRGANTTNAASRKLAYVDTGNFAFYGDTALNGVKLANDTYPSANNAYTLGSDALRWGDFRTQVGQCYGAFSKGSGTFDIEHPILEGKRLRHSFIEGPRYDLIYRGRVTLDNGQATVNMDTDAVSDGGQAMTSGTFVALTRDPDVFLQNKSGWARVKGVIDGSTLTITSESPCDDVVSWMVIAERHDSNVLSSHQCDDKGRLILEYDSSELSKSHAINSDAVDNS